MASSSATLPAATTTTDTVTATGTATANGAGTVPQQQQGAAVRRKNVFRNQDKRNLSEWRKTSRACPAFVTLSLLPSKTAASESVSWSQPEPGLRNESASSYFLWREPQHGEQDPQRAYHPLFQRWVQLPEQRSSSKRIASSPAASGLASPSSSSSAAEETPTRASLTSPSVGVSAVSSSAPVSVSASAPPSAPVSGFLPPPAQAPLTTSQPFQPSHPSAIPAVNKGKKRQQQQHEQGEPHNANKNGGDSADGPRKKQKVVHPSLPSASVTVTVGAANTVPVKTTAAGPPSSNTFAEAKKKKNANPPARRHPLFDDT